MPRHAAPFKIRMVGRSHDHARFVVMDNRRLVDMFWTGSHWSRSLRDANLYADPDDVNRTIKRLTRRHLRRHLPKRLFTLTVVVMVHADEAVSKGDVERYLNKAMTVSLHHDRHGTGPTPGSLVEVSVPVISLEDGR